MPNNKTEVLKNMVIKIVFGYHGNQSSVNFKVPFPCELPVLLEKSLTITYISSFLLKHLSGILRAPAPTHHGLYSYHCLCQMP